ncbi:GNAT family N-acetyltransferase [Lacihabitans lacunae]|uniref:GNAT family N-acetyltransferase n=1 Tax=Lacihabitans lacunae TaxID=1028214 RepID=A0ABV7YVA4_9BACT
MDFVQIYKELYPAVAQIYLEGIQTGMATFETQVPTWEHWDQNHLPFGRIGLFCEGKLKAWGTLTPVSKRKAYAGVAEVSVYVSSEAQGKGCGTLILEKLIEISEQHNIWTLQSGIMSQNLASIKLHEKCGFRTIGFREKVALLNGVWTDNTLMERRSKIVGV